MKPDRYLPLPGATRKLRHIAICAILFSCPQVGLGQQSTLCQAVENAQAQNAVVRVTTMDVRVRVGRVRTSDCFDRIVVGTTVIPPTSIELLEERRTRQDSVLNGILIGSVAAATIGGLVVVFGSHGDAEFVRPFIGLAPIGALGGFLVDAARERTIGWITIWKRSG